MRIPRWIFLKWPARHHRIRRRDWYGNDWCRTSSKPPFWPAAARKRTCSSLASFIPTDLPFKFKRLQFFSRPPFFCHTSTIRKDRFWQWSDCSWTSLASPTTSSTSADPEPAIPTCSFCTRPTTEPPTYIRLRLPPFRQPATLCTANFSVMTARLGD